MKLKGTKACRKSGATISGEGTKIILPKGPRGHGGGEKGAIGSSVRLWRRKRQYETHLKWNAEEMARRRRRRGVVVKKSKRGKEGHR